MTSPSRAAYSERFDSGIAMPAPFWKAFGPGLLWASAAIGVSHLVQSTRAGADGGFAVAWVILAALVLSCSPRPRRAWAFSGPPVPRPTSAAT